MRRVLNRHSLHLFSLSFFGIIIYEVYIILSFYSLPIKYLYYYEEVKESIREGVGEIRGPSGELQCVRIMRACVRVNYFYIECNCYIC